METPTWFDLGPDYGVLELNEEVTLPGPALELHLMMSERGGLVAWWSTERGESRGLVLVGGGRMRSIAYLARVVRTDIERMDAEPSSESPRSPRAGWLRRQGLRWAAASGP